MNNQKSESVKWGDGESLDVHSIFNTIQGEGIFSGRSATFIRLAGCNLQCPMCDTDYTTKRSKTKVCDIVDFVSAKGRSLVVITGGEPFRQDITKLTNKLLDLGKEVQVETNGTLYLPDFPYDRVTVMCSPKTPNINTKLESKVTAYKYVLSHENISENFMPTKVLGLGVPSVFSKPKDNTLVFVQPCDSGNEKENKLNLSACIGVVEFNDYTLCLQTHKIIGVE